VNLGNEKKTRFFFVNKIKLHICWSLLVGWNQRYQMFLQMKRGKDYATIQGKFSKVAK
jgi:hypothetical protein